MPHSQCLLPALSNRYHEPTFDSEKETKDVIETEALRVRQRAVIHGSRECTEAAKRALTPMISDVSPIFDQQVVLAFAGHLQPAAKGVQQVGIIGYGGLQLTDAERYDLVHDGAQVGDELLFSGAFRLGRAARHSKGIVAGASSDSHRQSPWKSASTDSVLLGVRPAACGAMAG